MQKIKYVQLEPAEYPTDHHWLAMTSSERGCFHSLLIFLYCGDGTLPNDVQQLSNLCNCSAQNFENFWSKYKSKFIIRKDKISHKRVMKERKKAHKYIKQKQLAGKASGNARRTAAQRKSSDRLTDAELKKREVKRSKEYNISKYSLQNCLDAGMILGIPDDQTEEFFHYYKAQGWRFGNGVAITNLKSAMVRWRKNQFRFEKEKPQSFTERDAAETNKARAAAKARFDKK